ncbi:hypothetical protein [Arachnia propionica]|uniref:hypothetical protein n=1 Tax=Arachnia propionica TaxID=1750 RepID=UPI0028EF63E3|nr:hypothetical protein [Arachnia propionica]
MNDISPSDPTYAETFARLSKLIAQEEREHGRIAEMSQASLRDWLNGFMQEAAKVLGIAAAKIAAMVADYVQISRNAFATAKDEFRKSYKASRRIGPL